MLSILSWWAIAQLFGLAALPIAWRLFQRLPGRGYAFAKPLGLLLVAYVLWLGASFRLLPNTAGGILASLALVGSVSWWWGRDVLRNGTALTWLRDNRRTVVTAELLFASVFIGWAVFRAYNPDIAGTEKPMEFAFLNGVLRSRFFPPQDPWLSGYAISYYYFGYVMLGVLVKLSGVLPEVGFNLGLALWYGLVCISAFGIVYDLVRLATGADKSRGIETEGVEGLAKEPQARAIRYGLLGALFVGFLGNLEALVELAYQMRLAPLSLIRWFDIKQLTDSPPSGGWSWGFWWWWRASRVIHDRDLLGQSVEVIDEFPFFSFLLGDMHPHVLALPFVLLAIGLTLALMISAFSVMRTGAQPEAGRPGEEVVTGDPRGAIGRGWRLLGEITGAGTPGIILCAIVLGSLAFLNTWDFPIYVMLVTLALGVARALRRGRHWLPTVAWAAGAGAALAALGWVCYLPFYLGFTSQFGGILLNLFFPTRVVQFCLMFGSFLVPVVLFLLLLVQERKSLMPDQIGGTPRDAAGGDLRAGASSPRGSLLHGLFLKAWLIVLVLPLLGSALVATAVLLSPQGRALLQDVLNNPAVSANVGGRSGGELLALIWRVRAANPWTYLLLALLLALAIAILWVRLAVTGGDSMANVRTDNQTEAPIALEPDPVLLPDLYVVLMILLGLALPLAVEFVYLRDLFGTRMNTVFKFYYQAWVLLSLAAAYGLSRLRAHSVAPMLRIPATILATLVVIGGLAYPVGTIPSKADGFRGAPSLDGLAYLRRSNPADMAAIGWIRANVSPQAVVLEATGGSYSPEGAGRVSMSTGNPTLLGWDFHEMQWRGEAYRELAGGRPEALIQVYRAAPAEELPALLDRWGIDYVYVGDIERHKYGMSDASLARLDRVLTRAYDKDGVVIYAR